MSVLPSLGRREPSPRRALPLLPRSYGLMRRSRHLSPNFGSSPRSQSLRRLRSAPAGGGTFPTLSLGILPWIPGPLSRRYLGVRLPVSSPKSSAFPTREIRVGFPRSSVNTIFDGINFGTAAIPLCSGLQVCSPPRSFPPQVAQHPWAAEAFTRAEHASFPPHASDIANHPNTGN